MTQDNLPPGPWSVGWEDTADGPEWFVEHTNSRTTIAYGLESEHIARAIAAIPEMRVENERLQTAWHDAECGRDKYRAELDRLRAENAMLIRNGRNQDSIELDRLRAEKERLRRALRKFVTDGMSRAEANAILAEIAPNEAEPT